MNRRILKKLSKRAAAVLVAEHGFRPSDFRLADGDETLFAPDNLPMKQSHSGVAPGTWMRDYFSPLKGTPLHYRQTSIEYNEYQAEVAHDTLQRLDY